mmetsp:Transcript_8974/g.26390  ORF Transcript_8974/g.26390 Transcript_8974/m.26390 type:complete len:368 (+) Transcript_8974:695-1798(+)
MRLREDAHRGMTLGLPQQHPPLLGRARGGHSRHLAPRTPAAPPLRPEIDQLQSAALGQWPAAVPGRLRQQRLQVESALHGVVVADRHPNRGTLRPLAGEQPLGMPGSSALAGTYGHVVHQMAIDGGRPYGLLVVRERPAALGKNSKWRRHVLREPRLHSCFRQALSGSVGPDTRRARDSRPKVPLHRPISDVCPGGVEVAHDDAHVPIARLPLEERHHPLRLPPPLLSQALQEALVFVAAPADVRVQHRDRGALVRGAGLGLHPHPHDRPDRQVEGPPLELLVREEQLRGDDLGTAVYHLPGAVSAHKDLVGDQGAWIQRKPAPCRRLQLGVAEGVAQVAEVVVLVFAALLHADDIWLHSLELRDLM